MRETALTVAFVFTFSFGLAGSAIATDLTGTYRVDVQTTSGFPPYPACLYFNSPGVGQLHIVNATPAPAGKFDRVLIWRHRNLNTDLNMFQAVTTDDVKPNHESMVFGRFKGRLIRGTLIPRGLIDGEGVDSLGVTYTFAGESVTSCK